MRQRQKLYSQGGTLQVMKWCINELFFTSSLKIPYHFERPTAYSQYQFQCIHQNLPFFRFRGKTMDDEWRFNKSVEASKLLRPLSPSPRSNLGFNIAKASIHHDDLKTTFCSALMKFKKCWTNHQQKAKSSTPMSRTRAPPFFVFSFTFIYRAFFIIFSKPICGWKSPYLSTCQSLDFPLIFVMQQQGSQGT